MTATPRSARGRFITLEGIEGVGKSTNLAYVADQLRRAGRQVVVTREPGGVPMAERIRELILAPHDRPVPPWTELLLMFAARSAHLSELVWPEIEQGRWVVCDRFTDATYAYQGAGRGLPEEAIRALESMVQGTFQPDLTLLLDADWATTRARRDKRGVDDRFEQENREFFDRVRAGYLRRAAEQAARFRVIDASADIGAVQLALSAAVSGFLADRA